jgi:cysteinyl-tRNA synthetase
MHNEMLQVEGRKMSKSLGNFFTVRDLLDQGVPGEVIRFVFLSTHYRKPMDWTENMRRTAHRALSNIYENFENALHNFHSDVVKEKLPEWREKNLPNPSPTLIEALASDLNTSDALRVFREHARRADNSSLHDQLQVLANGRFLGFFSSATLAPAVTAVADLKVYAIRLKELHQKAMETKDFSEVDDFKNILIGSGILVQISKSDVKLLQGPDFDPSKLEALK